MRNFLCLIVLAVAGAAVACGSDESPVGDTGGQAAAATTTATPAAGGASRDDWIAVDVSALPLGDSKISAAPKSGSVYSCLTTFNGGGAFRDGDWISADGTWDATAKVSVDGSVTWPSEFSIVLDGAVRRIVSNDLPDHATGEFPVSAGDDAYDYDRNPNAITAQDFEVALPASPEIASKPSCVGMGPIGVLLTGGYLFNAIDARGLDAPAHEIQDDCQGHPEQSGSYHYHNLTNCLEDTAGPGEHSSLVGYALDGFGIYGHQGENGETLTNADLDACHGHTHLVEWDGEMVEMYHYHASWEYPYTVGCFMGTPAMASGVQMPAAGQPR